ncbi:T9SS type A sorting domain-containing protein [candidate division TA06 bacterium]|uniref:T9SS type A sorting domain-containing protein n=1 Tax=candidate division TA06 bacterium TaxID=2250710 RepID=A0A523UR91_UNCT6|nr:MAG: T9SS type A sorting domain-containing protein [candidate division TA06 bacterium]
MNRVLFLLVVLIPAACFAYGPRTDRFGVFSKGEEFLKPLSESASLWHLQDEDTISYDDGYGYWYSVAGSEWGVRFTAELPCTVRGVLVMSFGFGADCSLFVRDDSTGLPGPIVLDTFYQGGSYPLWDRIDLPNPYYEMNSFWITGRYPKPPYILADSINQGHRSYYSFDGQGWLPYSAGDLMIRAIVAYGETLVHDISITNLSDLPTGVRVDTQYVFKVVYRNLGSSLDSFVGQVIVQDSKGFIELDTLTDTISVMPRQSGVYNVTWTPDKYGETYSVTATSHLSGDMNPENDTFLATTYSYMDGEIYYDDFSCELWLNVDRDDNDKFGVKFALPGAPSYISGARLFVDDTLRFDNLALCPDSGGLPDTLNPYVTALNIVAGERPSWIWVDFDTSLTLVDADTVWLVVRWPDSKSGPYIGSDRDYPIDGNSWAYSDSTGWKKWTQTDFMMRIVSIPLIGIEEAEVIRPSSLGNVRAFPNPFSTKTRLTLVQDLAGEDPGGENISVVIYDLSGRSVKRFSNAEMAELLSPGGAVWNGTDDKKASLPSGLYFLVLRTSRSSFTTKTVILR